MADVTNELMYELLKKLNHRFDKVDHSIGELRNEMQSIRGTMIAMQQDTANIYAVLARHETRLEMRDLAEAQARFEPHP